MKLLPFAVVAVVFGAVMPRVVRASFAGESTAGFGRGVAHGALMPLAMPQLLFGKDVTIYASENSGRTYKLGYTVGVNTCGAVFFGLAYWRWNRWRRVANS